MRMTLEEYTARFPERPKPIPLEMAGQWLAWNQDCTQILAHGKQMNEVWEQAVAQGCERPVLHKVPRGPFIGRQ